MTKIEFLNSMMPTEDYVSIRINDTIVTFPGNVELKTDLTGSNHWPYNKVLIEIDARHEEQKENNATINPR